MGTQKEDLGLLCVFVLLFSRFNSRSIFTSFKLIQDLAYSRVLIFMICIFEPLSHISQNTKPKPSTPSSPPISGLILISGLVLNQNLRTSLRWEIFSKSSSKSQKSLYSLNLNRNYYQVPNLLQNADDHQQHLNSYFESEGALWVLRYSMGGPSVDSSNHFVTQRCPQPRFLY